MISRRMVRRVAERGETMKTATKKKRIRVTMETSLVREFRRIARMRRERPCDSLSRLIREEVERK